MTIVSRDRASGYLNPGDPGYELMPTLDEIITIKHDYMEYYENFHKQSVAEEKYYFGENTVPVPTDMNIDPVRPATATAIVNVAADHVDIDNLAIDVPLASRRAAARAEKLKKFYIGSWMSMKQPVKKTAVKQAFLYGISFMKVMFKGDAYPEAPNMEDYGLQNEDGDTILIDESAYKEALSDFLDKRKIVFPFTVKNVKPTNMIWDDSKEGISWAIEFYDSKVSDIKRKYPQWVSDKKDHEMSTYMEYWDGEYAVGLADEQIVWGPIKHGYGFMPFIPVVPGNSISYDDGDPARRYRGILKPVHSLLDSEARLMTQYEAVLRQYAYRTLDFYGNRQSAQETADTYEIFGSTNIVLPGVEVRPSPIATPPGEILQQLSLVQNLIEEATFPNVVRGMRPSGVSTGFGVSVLAGMGRLVFQGVASGMARAIEQVNSNLARLVENKVMGPITVHARSEAHSFDQTIDPDDVKGYYENIVTLKAEAPEERERESLLAMRLRQPGPDGMPLISLYEAMKRSGVANPLEMMNQIAAEMIAFSPQARDEQLNKFLSQLGGQMQQQLGQAAGNTGNQFLPGQSQLREPGQTGIQRQRTQNNPATFPQGEGGIDNLAALFGQAPGGAAGVPSGQTVRRNEVE
tara:strand:+ start:98 stop:1996 length:1899 start_codon:yes stop_codon:yes gene_type:complete